MSRATLVRCVAFVRGPVGIPVEGFLCTVVAIKCGDSSKFKDTKRTINNGALQDFYLCRVSPVSWLHFNAKMASFEFKNKT